METYIHPNDEKIKEFIQKLELEHKDLEEVVHIIFKWFDSNVKYSRLNAPFYPLQRSDLDVLNMLSGTCGDYSNLLVSVFTTLGYETGYAYVKVDCYENPQDHICAAVLHNDKWILIDATLPYRRWHGYDCQHKEYELLSVEEFLVRMKKEESYWTEKADNIWDAEQWGEEYLEIDVPEIKKEQYYDNITKSIRINIPVISELIL